MCFNGNSLPCSGTLRTHKVQINRSDPTTGRVCRGKQYECASDHPVRVGDDELHMNTTVPNPEAHNTFFAAARRMAGCDGQRGLYLSFLTYSQPTCLRRIRRLNQHRWSLRVFRNADLLGFPMGLKDFGKPCANPGNRLRCTMITVEMAPAQTQKASFSNNFQ